MIKLNHQTNQLTCQVLKTTGTMMDQMLYAMVHRKLSSSASFNSKTNEKANESPGMLQQVFGRQQQTASLLTVNRSVMTSIMHFSDLPNQNSKSAMSETRDDEVLKDLELSTAPLAKSVFSDLHMFLQEVGTDPKEARFWLKHFQSALDDHRPFAVVQIDQEVIHNKKTLDNLCSCLSFLHRHQMQVVIVHGPTMPSSNSHDEYQAFRKQLVSDSMKLIDALKRFDAISRPIIHGASVFQVQQSSSSNRPELSITSVDAVQWSLRSGSIVLVQSLGELSSGQLVPIDIMCATSAIAKELKPLKVLLINNNGGWTNEKGQVIANVNIPNDLKDIYQSAWCTSVIKEKINDVVSLLSCLPIQSSVVISSASRLLAELFTHRGSGTFFKMSECIHKFENMSEVDHKKLSQLIESGFRRKLDKQYLEKLDKLLNAVYIVEGYAAAAIITNEDGISVPYLDKFVVCSARAGESLGQMLWDSIRLNYPQLFWRSRNSNIINTWYFMQCDGCRRFDQWTVFWYGNISDDVLSRLMDYALSLPSSFRTGPCVE